MAGKKAAAVEETTKPARTAKPLDTIKAVQLISNILKKLPTSNAKMRVISFVADEVATSGQLTAPMHHDQVSNGAYADQPS